MDSIKVVAPAEAVVGEWRKPDRQVWWSWSASRPPRPWLPLRVHCVSRILHGGRHAATDPDHWVVLGVGAGGRSWWAAVAKWPAGSTGAVTGRA